MVNKYILFGLLGLIVLSTGYSALTDGLLAYYKLDESSGTTAVDSTGTYDGTTTNALPNNLGYINTGYKFDGNGDYVSTSQYSLNGAGALTMSAWINTSDLTAVRGIFQQRGTKLIGLSIASDTSGRVEFYGINNAMLYSPSISAYSNQWLFVTATYDGSKANIYLNGVNVSQLAMSGTFIVDDVFKIGIDDFNAGRSWNGLIDEVGIWNRALSAAEVLELYYANTNGTSYPFTNTTIYDYNLTAIFDNTTSHLQEFNKSFNLLLTGYNATALTPQSITLVSADANLTATNLTSNVDYAITLNNASVSNYTFLAYDPFNTNLNITFYITIDDVNNLTYANSSTFFNYNSTQALNFTTYLNSGVLTCNDYYNLTIPLAGITNRLVKSCDLTSVLFNNSAVYNYTAYLTNVRFGRTINNTYNFYTNAYNLSIPTYNSTIANNTLTDIAWYLTTIPGYASSNQNVNVSINFNGTTTYPTATGLNYTYYNLLNSTELVETLPFYLILNLTFGNESLLFNTSYSLTITTIELDNCDTYSNVLLNLSMLNEIGKTFIINVSSILVNFNISNALISIEVINDTDGIIPICINNTAGFNADVEFQFSGTGYGATDKYTREHFYINNYFVSNNTQQQSTYQLTNDLALKKIFNIYDSSDNPLSNHYVVVKKWYGDGYETVAMAKTDSNGEALTYVQYYNTYYALDILDEDGDLVFTVSKNLFINLEDTIRVTDTVFTQYESLFSSFDTSASYNSTSNVFSTIITNNQGTESVIRLIVKNQFGVIQCDDNYTTSSVTATCSISNPEGNSYTAQAYATVSGQNVYLYIYEFDEALSTLEDYGQAGSLYAGLIVLGLAFAGSLFGFFTMPLMAFFGLMISNFIGFIALDAITLAGTGVMSVLMMVWFLRK